MLTKTQAKIMEIFTAGITKRFSIKEISEILAKPYPLIHRSFAQLIEEKFVARDEKNFLHLNCKENIQELAYIESIREKYFLRKNKSLGLFAKDVLEKSGLEFFIFLIFGSAARGKKNPRDVDCLFIVEDKSKVNRAEKLLENIASNFSQKFDINVISAESAKEMLSKREQANVINESLDNHIIIFGAESFYRLIKNAR